jgi:hypothetical protein
MALFDQFPSVNFPVCRNGNYRVASAKHKEDCRIGVRKKIRKTVAAITVVVAQTQFIFSPDVEAVALPYDLHP